jgi:Ca2+-binding EF-hand superfamily protein
MVADWIFTKHKDDLWEAYFEKQLSKITLNKMDKDKDGNVSYNDFLEYMLIRCELIDQEDLDRIYDRFQELDTDNDNMLNEKDVLIQNKV